MRNKYRYALFILLITAGLLGAQQSTPVTVEWIYSDDSSELTRLPETFWRNDNTLLIYDTRKPAAQRQFEILDPQSGKRTMAFDAGRALASLRQLRAASAPEVLPWPEQFSASGDFALYLLDGDIFLLDCRQAAFRRVTKTESSEKNARFSPDGGKIAFVRENDLYLYDIAAQAETRLTSDGSDTILNGTVSWVYWEEVFGREDLGYWWSDDSKSIAFFRSDDSPVAVSHFLDYQPAVARVITQRYPKAGMANPVVTLGIADVQTAQTTWADFTGFDYEYLVRVNWLPGSNQVAVQTLNRPQDRLDLFFIDRDSGAAQKILTETDPGWVNMHDDLTFVNSGNEFLWQSERDGYAHLYRFSLDGKLINQITKGNWAVKAAGGDPRKAIVAVDEANDWIYFSALEKSSVERHLYRVHFDGSGMERLSSGDGTWTVHFSRDGRYYSGIFSNRATPPGLALYRNDGTPVMELAAARSDLAEQLNFRFPELLEIPTSDGFPMPAEILKPADFDPGKKYPVIMNIYGGPSAPTVANVWSARNYFDQVLSDHGYIVVRFDHRAAAGISKQYENLLLKKFISEVELGDIVDGIKWLKAQPWADGDRFGIWGWSGGGSFTLHSMTRTKEFKAGIAVAAVTDWHFYDTRWAEFAMKTPQENPDGYTNTSILRHAKNLHGRLLLVHGSYDDNVHPQNAWSFIEQLVQANIPFDMMIYPMRKHGIADRPARIHLYSKMLEFWQENL